MMRFSIRFLTAVLAIAPFAAAASQATPIVTASATTSAADPVRDQAIAQLEAFLSKYPNSGLRPNALFELGELLVQRADERFNESQRANSAVADSAARSDAPIRPDYAAAITRYEELVRRYPTFQRIDAAAYTLGTLYAFEQRWPDAARMFEMVVASKDSSNFRPEALFRLGDSYFELASKERGTQRRALFARAATAYEEATRIAPQNGDIYFLALYKLGWSYYNQASQTGQAEYNQAVDVFGRLVAAYDKLSAEQQARLGLRTEAIEYMAIAFTQVGGSEAARAWFEKQGGTPYRLTVMQRVAASLRDQGDFPRAVVAYRALLAETPNDSSALNAQREIVDIYQNRMIEPDSAHAARLELVEKFAPGTAWAQANPGLADSAKAAREVALRQSAQYVLAQAQRTRNREGYAQSAALYDRYLAEFGDADSARISAVYQGEALFGMGEYMRAGAAYARGAQGDTSKLGQDAWRSAIVAYDSAVVKNKTDKAAQDAMFATVDAFVAAYPTSDVAKAALIQKGKRASETQRWDVMAETFRQYAQRYPNDPYTPTAQRLVGDAMFKAGSYADAQTQWESAEAVARSSGRARLADSIAAIRRTAVDQFADTLIKQGEYERAAEEVYIAFAEKNQQSDKAPEALKNAIETYLDADSVFKAAGDAERSRRVREKAVRTIGVLAERYPTYRYRQQYQRLAATLQAGLGNREEAAASMQQMIADNPNMEGRADMMIQLAVTLDSAGKKVESAQAYEQFATAYPRDRRASDALWNAAITYREAGDREAEARVMATYVNRFGATARGDSAAARRIVLLRELGDSTTADREFTRLCQRSGNKEAVRDACQGRLAEIRAKAASDEFQNVVAAWDAYKSIRFEFATKAQLTSAGIERAQSAKRQARTRLTTQLRRVAASKDATWASAAAFTLGMVSWEYGKFLEDIRLPEGLTDEESAAATAGAQRLAAPHLEAARTAWQELIAAAERESLDNAWVQRARAALEGNVPEAPPTAAAPRVGPMLVGMGGSR